MDMEEKSKRAVYARLRKLVNEFPQAFGRAPAPAPSAPPTSARRKNAKSAKKAAPAVPRSDSRDANRGGRSQKRNRPTG